MEVDVPTTGNAASAMEQTYRQCKAAREASAKAVEIDVSFGDTCMKEELITRKSFGSLADNSGIKNFCGSRLTHAGVDVNQSISCSFDPANLKCITCDIEHPILNMHSALTICFADQHFVPDLAGNAGGCISVARMEDASLPDIVTFCMEILDRHPPPRW